jgi:hypothetical protein
VAALPKVPPHKLKKKLNWNFVQAIFLPVMKDVFLQSREVSKLNASVPRYATQGVLMLAAFRSFSVLISSRSVSVLWLNKEKKKRLVWKWNIGDE